MKSGPKASSQEVLAGLVERVTFHNAENGFCVLRAKAPGHRDLVTVVGHAAIISAGEWITASGEWINDRAHGQQFKARFFKTSAPVAIDEIEKYLGSGMIRGIGPVPPTWRPLEDDGLYSVEAECIALHDDLAASIFGGLDVYWKLLLHVPPFLSQAGLNAEAPIGRDDFEKALVKLAGVSELNRFLYLYDCQVLVSAIQECTKEVSQLTSKSIAS